MQVSVLIITFNEEKNIPRCLDALSWCRDIIVVDSGSVDATRAIARARGARVLNRPFDNFANQRNFGLVEGRPLHQWVLHLDADEVVTPAFYEKLTALTETDEIDAYRVPSMTMLHGRWLRHAGMYPSYQVRLGHRERFRFVQVGHGQREDLPPTRVRLFDEPYLHFNFSHGLESWLRKHVDYAREEAKLILAERRNLESQRLSRRSQI
jgi:glycosyltransferase involved in cell wall biosynthesis